MKRFLYIFRELYHLVATHKLYFIAPLLLALGLLTFLVFYLGPKIVITFLYAGV